ncbi:MAG: ATP-binding cassette domain-containing protein [Pseudomonadota bacterium]
MAVIAEKKRRIASTGTTVEGSAHVRGRTKDASPGDINGLPLPAAMNRLAQHHGLGVDADDAALTREFGEKPHRESIHMLADELGADFKFTKRAIETFTKPELPVILLIQDGSAIILLERDTDHALIEDRHGCRRVSSSDLTRQSTGIALLFAINEKSTARLAAASVGDVAAHQSKDSDPATQKPQLDMMHWLVQSIWRLNRREMIQLLTASLLSNLFLIALPLFIMSVYDRVIPHTAFESLISLTLGVLIILGADLGIRYAKLKFTDAIGLKVSRRLQTTLYRRLLFIALPRRPKSAATINSVAQEIESICLMTPEFMISVISDSLLAFFILSLIAFIGGGIVIVPIIGLFCVAGAVFYGAWSSKSHAKQAMALRSAGSNQVSETFECLTAVKATGAEHSLLKRYERIAGATGLKGHHARQRSRFATQAAGVIVQATVVGSLVLGVIRIDAGLMSIGSLAATTILVGRAVMPISHLVDQFCRLWTLRDLLNGAAELLREPEETENNRSSASYGKATTFKGAISFRAVSYRHESSGVSALKNISLDINPGEKIGLIGKNGSGKSTFLHLLPKLYHPTDGVLLFDHADSRQYSTGRLRQYISLMPQETVLFNQTLQDNILLGTEDFDSESFIQANKISGVDRFAKLHPNGYSMEVGPRGEYLSAGERQAVGLSRALLKQRDILLLDEPTSLMDHTAEAQVITALRDHIRNKTLIVSTHRLRLLELVDRIIVLDRGSVTHDGRRDAILAALSAGKTKAAS